jgi:hypothetical protein
MLHFLPFPNECKKSILSHNGNVLVYIIVLMVIFAVLGVTMVSLFSTSISSTATPNENRRAFYISESGVRYAMSELRNNNFSKATITQLNDVTTYKMSEGGSFKLNVFSPWFESINSFDSSTDGQTISVRVPEGVLPPGYLTSLPSSQPGFFLVNYNYIDTTKPPRPQLTAFSQITGVTESSPTSLTLTLADDFVAGHNERVVMAVSPIAGNQNIPSQGHIDLDPVAKNIFPPKGGSFEVQKRNFFYTSTDDSNPAHIRLIGVKPVEKEATLPDIIVNLSDPIILSPRNRLIISEGKFGNVTFGNQLKDAYPIANTSIVAPENLKPDYEFAQEPMLSNSLNVRATTKSGYSFIRVDDLNRKIDIAGLSPSGFGATWFSDNREVGGNRDFCLNAGECLFNNGIRAFFILNYSGVDGDGFTFSIINAAQNSRTSVGGDSQLSELLAYAGDSRLIPNPTLPSNFLDNRGVGLVRPKMAVEFDGFTNNDTKDICADINTINLNTRYDPAGAIDRVQFVFWGIGEMDILPLCRPNLDGQNRTYDDNQHDAPHILSPENIRDKNLTTEADKLNVSGLADSNNWLTQGPWGVRIEIERVEATREYTMRTWMIKCSNLDCAESQPFYRSTRYKYDWTKTPAIPVMEQTFTLSDQHNQDFERFLFGFTSATSAVPLHTQTISINNFQLSFIRTNDPVVRD